MLALQGTYQNGQIRFEGTPPLRKTATKVIVTFLEEGDPITLECSAHLENIDSFAKLPQNWDTYNADVITPKSIAKAKQIVTKLHDIDIDISIEGVFPMRDGGVQIELHLSGYDIEIEIKDDCANLLFFSNNNLLENESVYNMNDIFKHKIRHYSF